MDKDKTFMERLGSSKMGKLARGFVLISTLIVTEGCSLHNVKRTQIEQSNTPEKQDKQKELSEEHRRIMFRGKEFKTFQEQQNAYLNSKNN